MRAESNPESPASTTAGPLDGGIQATTKGGLELGRDITRWT